MREYVAKKSHMEIKVTTLNGETKVLKTTEPLNASKASAIGHSWIKYEQVQEEKEASVGIAKKELRKYTNAPSLNDKDRERIKELEAIIEKNQTDDIGTRLSRELCYVYDSVKPEWFTENFDIITLQEILRDVAQDLAGLKKSEIT